MTSLGGSCSYCFENANGNRILCSTCKDFTLCLQCFASGAEIGPHKKEHDYQFVDAEQTFFRNSGNWSANEEIELLNGIEHCGYGNWDAIAKRIEPHTAEEACKEYITRFIDGAFGRVWTEGTEGSFQIMDLTQGLITATKKVDPLLTVPPHQLELLGYKPFRSQFKTEFDNDAEIRLTSRLRLNVVDDELDVELKRANIAMYQSCLKERERHKQMVFEYPLINKFFSYRRERFRNAHSPPGELEVYQKLRWLCQFRSYKEYDCMVKSIQRQRDLRRRLKELMKYRKNGITKIEELSHFDQESHTPRKRFDSSLKINRMVLKRNRESWHVNVKGSTHRARNVLSSEHSRQTSPMRSQTLPSERLSEREVKTVSSGTCRPYAKNSGRW